MVWGVISFTNNLLLHIKVNKKRDFSQTGAVSNAGQGSVVYLGGNERSFLV
jgi:hypothetical protein